VLVGLYPLDFEGEGIDGLLSTFIPAFRAFIFVFLDLLLLRVNQVFIFVLAVLGLVPEDKGLLLDDDLTHLAVLLLVHGASDSLVVGDNDSNQEGHHDH